MRRILEAAATCGRLCLLPFVVATAPAQTPSLPTPPSLPDERSVSGRVVRPSTTGVSPVEGAWVVLHRVGSDTAAPLDSLRSGAHGQFRFRYRAAGDPNAIYFVSASHAGIAYFGPPLRGRDVSGDDAEIVVYDTTSSGVPLHVRGRHLIVGASRPDGTRDIVEVFEIANDTSVTLLADERGPPTWSTMLPPGVIDFQVGQGDFAPQTIRRDGGRVLVSAPFAPGLKQLSFAYRLPQSSFPVTYPMGDGTTVLEVLLEEPGAAASGPALERVESVTVEGRGFRRYLAENVPARSVVRVTAPVVASSSERARWFWIVGVGIAVAMISALILALVRRRRRRPFIAPASASTESADVLARRIASLDEAFENIPSPDAARREAYEQERASLKTRLAHALAAGEPRA